SSSSQIRLERLAPFHAIISDKIIDKYLSVSALVAIHFAVVILHGCACALSEPLSLKVVHDVVPARRDATAVALEDCLCVGFRAAFGFLVAQRQVALKSVCILQCQPGIL